MLICGLLIYISFLFLKTRKEHKLLNVEFSKFLFSSCIYCFITTLYLNYLIIKKIMEIAKIAVSGSLDVLTVLRNNYGSTTAITNAIKAVRKPFIFMDDSLTFIIMYAITIFIICLLTYVKTKENKNAKTLITFISFAVGFVLFLFCPFTITCALIIFIPHILGLFLTIAVVKQLSYSRREEINIKGAKAHFVISVITLILVSLSLFLNVLWAVFGTHIIKSLSGLNISYV